MNPYVAYTPTQMPTSKFGEFWYGMPPVARGALALLGASVAAWAGFKIYHALKNAVESADTKAVANQSGSEVKKLQQQGQQLTYPDANYMATANLIKKRLDGCESFESEMVVVQAIARVVKKPVDWYHLVDVFGSKDIENCAWGGTTNYDLISLVKDQLDSAGFYKFREGSYSDSGFVVNSRDVLIKYLASKGIQF